MLLATHRGISMYVFYLFFRAVGRILGGKAKLIKEKGSRGSGGTASQKLEGVFIFTSISWHLNIQ